jgi:hypothetical protein
MPLVLTFWAFVGEWQPTLLLRVIGTRRSMVKPKALRYPRL